MGVTSRMFAANLLIAMLVVSSQAAQFQESEKALLEEDRFSPQFVLDLLIGLITDIIRDQILNILGITTTQATPILDALNDVPVIGALIPDKPTPTTTSSTTGPVSSTAGAPPGPVIGAIGDIIGLPGAVIGGILPGESSTTTTTSTTTTPTTTKCGGLFGGGLLGC